MKYITILIFLFSFNTFAQEECAKALQNICKDTPAGKLSDCYKANMKKLPAKCSSNMNSMQAMASEIDGNCMEEVNKLCPIDISALTNGGDVKNLVEGMSKCIQEKMSQLSSECKGKLKKVNDTVLDGEMDNGAKSKKIR